MFPPFKHAKSMEKIKAQQGLAFLNQIRWTFYFGQLDRISDSMASDEQFTGRPSLDRNFDAALRGRLKVVAFISYSSLVFSSGSRIASIGVEITRNYPTRQVRPRMSQGFLIQ
jgi:hypothetical protein